MIIIGAMLLGAVIGGVTAKRRGGNRLDIAQYAVGYAIAFTLVGVLATILVDRNLRS